MQRLDWDESVRSRAFWEAYISCGLWPEDYRLACPSLNFDKALDALPHTYVYLSFSFPEDHLLELNMSEDGSYLSHVVKNVWGERQGLCAVEHGGKGHFFRWEEFQAIVRYQIKTLSPVWAVELIFCMYVAVTPDIVNEWTALLRRCVEAAGVFTSAEVDYIVTYYRRYEATDLQWINKPDLGWVVEGGYSIRRDDKYSEFDFAFFNRFCQALSQDA